MKRAYGEESRERCMRASSGVNSRPVDNQNGNLGQECRQVSVCRPRGLQLPTGLLFRNLRERTAFYDTEIGFFK
jgi:hypothetical protein